MLVFDGDCGFCTASARWLEQRGAAVVAWQTLDLDEYPLTVAEVDEAAWWIDGSGVAHRGHRAIGLALRAAGGAWGIVGTMLVNPPLSWLAGPVYALVARNRHRLPGAAGADACGLRR